MIIKVSHINENNVVEVQQFVREKGLKPFHSLTFQFKKLPEGEYLIDITHIFSNQYNAKHIATDKSYRLFEYCRPFVSSESRLLNHGYYISEGIEVIRELQAQISVCSYCGKQYKNTAKEFCDSCWDSEYLEPKNYHLLWLRNICNEHRTDKSLPMEVEAALKQTQMEANLKRLEMAQIAHIKDLSDRIITAQKEFNVFEILYKYKFSASEVSNLIYYSHQDTFSFGWKNKLSDEEKENLKSRISKIDELKNVKFEYK